MEDDQGRTVGVGDGHGRIVGVLILEDSDGSIVEVMEDQEGGKTIFKMTIPDSPPPPGLQYCPP